MSSVICMQVCPPFDTRKCCMGPEPCNTDRNWITLTLRGLSVSLQNLLSRPRPRSAMSAACSCLPACLCQFKVCRRQHLHNRVRQTQIRRGERHRLHCSAQAAAVQTGTQELVQWLQQRGAPQTPCQITSSRNGLQLELMRALQPGETLFSIPSSCWITADTVR